ncbi:hypothetical protein FisN_11Lh345 [Fistulifera solaris]|uniref:Uncharacterized protein n=1 Tax=Fistulifera solaris TaxID=1519565 RepID=A0A1Z5K0G7_FISSO|nr:hypothetical protein FisN_11Lh345 [Fistulifera solaris]|eukprot:GAX19794.1 hypothetical protein FisN_11Lh345 [Fistulifera solaris]
MNARRHVPPAFYGIYNDGVNNPHSALSSDDVGALQSAALSLMMAAHFKGQRYFDEFRKKSEALYVDFEEKAIELDAATSEELRVVQDDLKSEKIAIWEAYRRRRDIDHKNADVAERINQGFENAQRQMDEEKEQLITALRDEVNRVQEGLQIVLTAHGLP